MNDSDAQQSGLRSRIRKPAPPAPVPVRKETGPIRQADEAPDLSSNPKARARTAATQGSAQTTTDTDPKMRAVGATATVTKAASASTATRSTSDRAPAQTEEQESDSSVVASTGSMAIATLISRITGFLRNLLIGAMLGPAVASAFNVANTLPNLITEIVLGAVLTSLVVPVLVRAEKEDPDHGAAFIRRLLTVSLTLLAVVTVLAVVGAPILTRMALNSDGEVNVPLATAFSFLLLPQIIFYGVFALLMAVLNTKGVFKPGAWAPVANNVVAIATLLLYWTLPGRIANDSAGSLLDPHILLLGLGTTLGVVVQAVIMIPPLRKAGIDLRPLWGIDDRIKQFTGMGLAIVTYVAISQAGFFITTQIASSSSEAAPTIYQQAWLLLQVPYGIIGVTLLTAIMPRLSRNAADGNNAAVVRDLSVGTRLTLIALIPIVAFFTAFGRPIAIGLFAYLEFPQETAAILGWTLTFSAFSLIPYALVLLHLRVFYAREEAWTPTFIILGITIVKVILSVWAPYLASDPQNVVVLLGAANGFGFVAGAIIGFLLLRRSLGHLDSRAGLTTSLWATGASLVGVLVAAVVYWLSDLGFFDFFGSFGFLLRTCLTGVVFLIATGIVLSRAPLPEVRTLGGFLGRIPGLRRFAPAPNDDDVPAAANDAEALAGDPFAASPSALIGEATGLAGEGFNATPLLPPMPTQGSRPVRYVPGEMVSGGRFRLRSEIAHSPGLRLWRAIDQGDAQQTEVALIFVDTILLPSRGGLPSEAADFIAKRTDDIRIAAGPGMSRIRSVAKTRTEVLIAADWIPSASIDSLSETPHPDAVALAVAHLADSVAAAHAQDRALGLEWNSSRLRISRDGVLFNAFPVVLPNATQRQDTTTMLKAAEQLLAGCPSVPHDISDALAAARSGDIDAATLAQRLRDAAYGPDSSEFPAIDTTDSGEFNAAKGFGGSRGKGKLRLAFGRARSFSTGVMVVGMVIVAAMIAAAVIGFLNRSDSGPITEKSVRDGGSAAANELRGELGEAISLADAEEWQVVDSNPSTGPDDPSRAPNTIDDDPETLWSTSGYLSQLGTGPTALKPGVGIVVDLQETTVPSAVKVLATAGAGIEVRGIDSPDATTLEGAPVIGSATTDAGETEILLYPKGKEFRYLLIWVNALPTAEASQKLVDRADQQTLAEIPDGLQPDKSTASYAPKQFIPVAIGDIKVYK